MKQAQREAHLRLFFLIMIALGLQGCTQLAGVQDWHPSEEPELPSDAGATLESADSHPPGECEQGTWRCQQSALQNCLSGQWQTEKTCVSAQLCDALNATCATPACSPGQTQCRRNMLMLCNASQSGWTGTACESDGLCNSLQARCDAPACTAGQLRCSGADLQTCNAALTGWSVAATCDTAELCDNAAGVCQPPACATGEYQCQGKYLMI